MFARLLALAREQAWRKLPIGERIGAVGIALLHTPYAAATLEVGDDREVCSVDLHGLDCVTFYEIAVCFARMLKGGGRTPRALLRQVRFTRYRAGRLIGYASRLHYTSDWFADNARKRVVRLVTRELPGAAGLKKRVNFMSTHPAAYPALAADRALVRAIARIEDRLNSQPMMYVPKDRVIDAQSFLMTGDIVGITTRVDGLDCAHTGLCYRDEQGRVRLLHASTTAREVTLDDELAAYLARVPTHTGIVVARPLEPTRRISGHG
ncbi:MAG: N-acetylmuramoyl-L-alanine amidase-like domain-containing protein [Candidatus Rokuibacteriota bacterium]